MKEQILFRDKDMIVMKLLHYFITEKGYSPIILRGIENEIWLENVDGPYRIVRIMTGYIHNNTQYDFDLFKTKKIIHQIKLKTLSFRVKTLSIFTDLSEYVELKKEENIDSIIVKKEEDIILSKEIKEAFSDINTKMVKNEPDVELFTKITSDLNNINKKKTLEAESLFNSKKPIITYVLIAINILIFLLMYLFGNGSEDINTLIKFGALSKAHILINNEYFRIITSAFLHIGLFHIMFNMWALYVVGSQVENYFGKIKFLIIYFGSIIVSSLVSLVFLDISTISAGASGAVFGLFGALLYFGYNYRAYLGNVLIRQILPVIILNIFIGFVTPGINNAAHLGGLMGGILLSYSTGIKNKSSKQERTSGIIAISIAIATLIYYVFFK
ncbi:MAG: rhomboid family intramembrane serine protease [Tenericutes bacterium]|nr:rhomboid family intramembrane serine protease [Bacilli bacterium]NLV89978.1 rhomboid family intramembrane serine protease [Mycoplasmatota bacterium]